MSDQVSHVLSRLAKHTQQVHQSWVVKSVSITLLLVLLAKVASAEAVVVVVSVEAVVEEEEEDSVEVVVEVAEEEEEEALVAVDEEEEGVVDVVEAVGERAQGVSIRIRDRLLALLVRRLPLMSKSLGPSLVGQRREEDGEFCCLIWGGGKTQRRERDTQIKYMI